MRLIPTALLGCWLSAAAAAPAILLERTASPPFGHTVGSVIHHRIHLTVPDSWRLDPTRLPISGPVNEWLEIRQLTWRKFADDNNHQYLIDIDYQIFPSLKGPTELTIPATTLHFQGPGHITATKTVPSWRFTAMPLIAGDLTQQPLQPLWQPMPEPLTAHWKRLAWLGGYLFALFGLLAWHRGWLSWGTPFRRALPKLRQAIRRQDTETAFRILHRALNETAGHALFPHRLEEFLQRHPDFAPLAPELERFFQTSHQVFFQGLPDPGYLPQLERLCRHCIKAEKPCRN